jgi:hypothetical protein
VPFQVGDDGFDRVGVLAENDDLLLRVLVVQGLDPAFQDNEFRLGSGVAGVDQPFEVVEAVGFVFQAAEFAAAALHGGEVATVQIALQAGLGFLRDGIAATDGAQVIAPDLDLGDGLRDVLLALGDGFPYGGERRCGALPQDGSDKADGLAVRAQRLFGEKVEVGGFFADGSLKSALLRGQRYRQCLDRLALHEFGGAIRQPHMALQPADHVAAVVFELQVAARDYERKFEEREQGGEVLIVAVVGSGGEQEQRAGVFGSQPAGETETVG